MHTSVNKRTLASFLLSLLVIGFTPCLWAETEDSEEQEIVIPLKTKYAPQEREAILGFDIAHSGEAETWITSLELEYSIYDRIEFDLELPVVASSSLTNLEF